jgi:receptor protein-tyrosine kinase
MSRVHDALRRAEQAGLLSPPAARPNGEGRVVSPASTGGASSTATQDQANFANLLEQVEEIPFRSAADSLLIDVARPHEAPMEEFRTLRTRLNHMKTLSPIHTVVMTSPSPAEGKSLSAANLALAQAHLAGNTTLLADFDFRRPIVHTLFGVDRSPGITDYLLGRIPLHKALRKVAGTNLYIMPAGEAVINPLELLNLREVKHLLDRLPSLFNWIILDSPPLLFAADANLLSTLCHGTLLVVRIGHTTIDSVTRAMQSLCNNNVLGIVVNGARRGELYSKYTYYHSYYTPKEEDEKRKIDLAREEAGHSGGHPASSGSLGLSAQPDSSVAVAEAEKDHPHA